MKLITLNIWGGKIYEPLIEFFEHHAKDTDIFCLQDLLFGSEPSFTAVSGGRINIFNELKKILSDFNYSIFRTPGESHFHDELLDSNIGCGQAIFVRKSFPILESGGFRTPEAEFFRGGDLANGKHHWVKFRSNGEDFTVMNVHGMWQRDSKKSDTPKRMTQSQNIKNFFDSVTGKKILCGDLNLAPNTEAMRILEENMVNLVKKYKIDSTRSSHYTKEGKFADYILVSEDVEVSNFKVLPDEVSDHLALMAEFIK